MILAKPHHPVIPALINPSDVIAGNISQYELIKIAKITPRNETQPIVT